MSNIPLPPKSDLESLSQLPKEELVSIIVQQQRVIEQFKQEIEQFKQEIERLKAQHCTDSQTSSSPPSTDLLKKSEKPKASSETTPGKRLPGGQPGHPGKTRKGFGRVDRYEILRPEQCSNCGGEQFQVEPVGVQHQQVARLVERPIEIVEYQRHSCECASCGQIVSAPWAADVVPGQDLSIGLQSLLVWLGNLGHLSYEKQQEFVWELGQVAVGVGTLQATNSRMASRVAGVVECLWEWGQQQNHVHVDETPWPVMGIKEWLWVPTGRKEFCLFHAGDTRSRDELETMLGSKFEGILSSDDFSVYNGYPAKGQQKCLAHLRRHFKKVIRLGHGNNPELGQAFLDLIDQAFAQHRQWRESQDDAAYRAWAESFKHRIEQGLRQWSGKAGHAAGILLRRRFGGGGLPRRTSASLRDKAAQWWYFLDYPEVPPDNNQAERSLRLAVTKRKVCGGSRAMDRFTQTADLLSVIQTCRAQGRSVIEFFKQVLMAHVSAKVSKPSLIPQLST